MKITVIICTYNRHQVLAKVLESVAGSTLPAAVAWEVLVVDNNSSDQTREVVESFYRRNPVRFRYLFEPRPGKSYALNSGIRNAQSDVLAFLDDDVTVEPTWLQNLTASLHDGTWAGAGGRILLEEPFSPPRWLSLWEPYDLGGALCALFDRGDKPGQLDRPPYGANMAYRRVMFEKYGSFRTDMGPSPNREIPRPNEDAEFGRRLMAASERLRYEPYAIVYHPVPEDRVKKKYFLSWWFDYGRALVREWGRGQDVWGIPRRYLSMLKIGTIVMAPTVRKWITAMDPQERFFRKCWVWMIAGEVRECFRIARRKTKMQEHDAISQSMEG
jgi:glucosyl-dolichyl phosphate glucuronosyltransferase